MEVSLCVHNTRQACCKGTGGYKNVCPVDRPVAGWFEKCVSASQGVNDVCTSALVCGFNSWDQWRCTCACTSGPRKQTELATNVHAQLTGLLQGKGWFEKCVIASLGVGDVRASA